MADLPLMPKATAIWLVENTTLTFEQIAAFTGLHILEVNGIADGDVAQGIKGIDPVLTSQLTREEIARCEREPQARLRLIRKAATLAPAPTKRTGPRYTPLSKRQDRPSAIAWLVRYHPELSDGQISKLVGTTKSTIQSVRDRTHWNMTNIRPVDPVALGLCKQVELDAAVKQAAARKAKAEGQSVLSDEEKMRLMSTEQSLAAAREPRLPSSMAGLENFTLTDPRSPAADDDPRGPAIDPESIFNLPTGAPEDEDDEFDPRH
jgi:hypothetical protein